MFDRTTGRNAAFGVSRRHLLKSATLGFAGMGLADLLRFQATAAPTTSRPKSAIMIFLSGGPSHVDMYDMKPEAPLEYRGEFQTIRTNVPGIEICELMPLQAQIADKFAILRGVQLAHLHSANAFYSGWGWQEFPRAPIPGEGRRPALGSIVSRLRPGAKDVPPYVSIENSADWERAYYAGVEFEPVRFSGSSPRDAIENMSRHKEITEERLTTRRDLLETLGSTNGRIVTGAGAVSPGLDRFQERALEIVGSTRVRDAFDLQQEPAADRARYGEAPYNFGPHPGKSLLLARRLIEAGVSVVTVAVHGWDTHSHNFKSLREMLPALDKALYALMTDLSDRGRLDDTIVVMSGEFGRTPRIGDSTPDGRGHWPDAGFLWIAGGGFRTGQTIGATDNRGEKIIGNPIGIQPILATIYRQMGIDPAQTLIDHNGRPQYLIENRELIKELL